MRWSPLALLCSCLLMACSSGEFVSTSARSVPAFSAPNQYGEMVALQEVAKRGPWTVLFFYPEADTPG